MAVKEGDLPAPPTEREIIGRVDTLAFDLLEEQALEGYVPEDYVDFNNFTVTPRLQELAVTTFGSRTTEDSRALIQCLRPHTVRASYGYQGVWRGGEFLAARVAKARQICCITLACGLLDAESPTTEHKWELAVYAARYATALAASLRAVIVFERAINDRFESKIEDFMPGDHDRKFVRNTDGYILPKLSGTILP